MKRRSSTLTAEQRMAQTAAARAARGAPEGTVLLALRVRVAADMAERVAALTPPQRGEILSTYILSNQEK